MLHVNLTKYKWLRIYFLIFAFVASFAGNTYACLFPHSMQTEKFTMMCETSEISSPGTDSQPGEDCKQTLLDEGRVSHANSSSQLTFLRIGQSVSTSLSPCFQNMIFPQDPFLLIFKRTCSISSKIKSVPIYTSIHSFLI